MVVRKEKRSRKYLGTRRWGVGNIKNNRGAGGQGGVGRGGKKHKWTYITAKRPDLIRHIGFNPWHRKKLKEISLANIEKMIIKDNKAKLEFKDYKVLGSGSISKGAVIKASGFSASAMEKIKSAGGEAIKI